MQGINKHVTKTFLTEEEETSWPICLVACSLKNEAVEFPLHLAPSCWPWLPASTWPAAAPLPAVLLFTMKALRKLMIWPV